MKKKELTQDTYKYKKWGRGGGGGGGGGRGTVLLAKTYVEKRQVSFIYFIVDKIIILLSDSFKDGSPYKYIKTDHHIST